MIIKYVQLTPSENYVFFSVWDVTFAVHCLFLWLATTRGLWLEGIQLQPEMKNEINCIPIRLCFINVYTYPNPKPTPYRNEKIVTIVVQCDKNYAVLMCACPVAPFVSILALTEEAERCPKTVSCIPVTLNFFPSICMALRALERVFRDTTAPRAIAIHIFTIYECVRARSVWM